MSKLLQAQLSHLLLLQLSFKDGIALYSLGSALLREVMLMHDPFLAQAAAFASLNGVGLALVLPCVQSVLADVYSPERRGLAFGLVLTTGAVGEHLLGKHCQRQTASHSMMFSQAAATLFCSIILTQS